MERKNRSKNFTSFAANRYAWHTDETAYTPDCYQILSRREWKVLQKWFVESDKYYSPGTGECGIPAISLLTSLISGNGMSRVVELGTFIGYSTLLMGAALKRTGTGKLCSIDNDRSSSLFAQHYIHKMGLTDFVSLYLGDSTAETLALRVIDDLKGPPQLLFIDSSHKADQTYEELTLWAPLMASGGLIVIHATSRMAQALDVDLKGGAHVGMSKFVKENNYESIRINKDYHGLPPQSRQNLTYIDGLGIGIIDIGKYTS
jgi:predicted O-methyltransferase YrrM